MKKTFSLLLVLVLCLSLCACGENKSTNEIPEEVTETTNPVVTTMTKEEMLSQAKTVQISDVESATHENIAKAKLEYCDNILELTGVIGKIEEDHIELGLGWVVVDVYLPIDELVLLQTYQQVSIVGQTTDVIEKDPNQVSHFQMPVAYYVTDRFDIRCVPQSSDGIELIDSDGKQLVGICPVQWAEDVDMSNYIWQEITISAKCKYSYALGRLEYYDATIVE